MNAQRDSDPLAGRAMIWARLEGKAVVDSDTARRLFTLICVLHWG